MSYRNLVVELEANFEQVLHRKYLHIRIKLPIKCTFRKLRMTINANIQYFLYMKNTYL